MPFVLRQFVSPPRPTMDIEKRTLAKLILEDSTVHEGFTFGADKSISGEVVFNTGMVGYPGAFARPPKRGTWTV